MAQPIDVGMPRDLDLGQGYVLRVTALDPTSGSTVAGVKVSNVVITATNLTGGSLASGSFLLVPGPGVGT